MNFKEAIEYLLSLGHETLAIKLGLRNPTLLFEALDNPQQSFQSVQIAGTNGKGSTAVILESICRTAAISTGLYTSPHLISVTERIRINGREISEAEFAKLATRVREAAERLLDQNELETPPTFFEQVTAVALLAFKEAGIELAILETGLGGRLDATTVAGATIVGITPIALDHQEYLGETLAEIAGEKAAIIRPGATAVVATQEPAALEVILRRCAETGVEPDMDECKTTVEDVTDDGRCRVAFETPQARYNHVLLGLRGRHQLTNAAVAIRLAEILTAHDFRISEANIVEGLEKARHPGRLELFDGTPRILLDGAHNPPGAAALRAYLDEFVSSPLTIVFGAMKDKRLAEIAAILFPAAGHLIFTRPDNPRAADVDDLKRLAEAIDYRDRVTPTRSVAEAMAMAKELTPSEGTICVTGSLYLVGEVTAWLKVNAQG